MGMTMSETARTFPGQPAQADSPTKNKPRARDAMSRIKLALLEQYSQQAEKSGSDPYNTNSSPRDQWRGNARRI